MKRDAKLNAQKTLLKGPVANNGLVNFIRSYAEGRAGGGRRFDLTNMVECGKAWNRLPLTKRDKYRKMLTETKYHVDDGCCPMKRKPKNSCKPKCPVRKKPACRPACPKPKSACSKPKPSCPKPACAKPKPTCPKPKPTCPKPKPTCRPKKPACRKRKPACRPKKPACRRPKPKCKKRKFKCQKPGPIMNNGYLNYLRVYRRKHCGLSPKDMFIKSARAWCKLDKCQKDRYRRQACKVTTSCRHKRRRVCTE